MLIVSYYCYVITSNAVMDYYSLMVNLTVLGFYDLGPVNLVKKVTWTKSPPVLQVSHFSTCTDKRDKLDV